MLKRSFTMIIALMFLLAPHVKADEGMWLPFLIQKYNLKEMRKMGLRLTAEQIYSINKSSMKDAVVSLDHGSCTAELISGKGLLLTNHHCGYGEIQAHSTVEHDYLTDGFWAKKLSQELPNPGKTASFLVKMEDVTEKVVSQLNDKMTPDERTAKIQEIAKKLEAEVTKGSHYEASVESFFHSNYFYMFTYETFKDIRLVGAPPSSIGKYGADTDNWMWPRHTADFAMFRIYAGPDGKPAEFSEKNIPHKPKHFFPVSMKGVKKGDFAMVMGYPGSTNRYLTSWGVKQTMENENTIRIKIRGLKQRIIKEDMNASDKVRIQYASKYSRSTNYYKYSIGQNKGLKRLKVYEKKQALEKKFKEWVDAKPERKAK